VNVTVPTYGVSSAQSENVALTVTSQSSSSAKRVVYVTTNTPSYSFNMTNFTGSNFTILGGQTQTYSFSMQNITGNSTIYSGQTHNYIIQIQNSGTGNDTIHLAVDGGSFDYSIRNALDTTNIIIQRKVSSYAQKSIPIKALYIHRICHIPLIQIRYRQYMVRQDLFIQM
jgi:hypothetical protein